MGYMGKLLVVDLERGGFERVPLEPGMARRYLGGTPMAARIFFERGAWKAAPLDPGNHLIVMTGPMTGTTLPATGRFTAAARSPLTGIWGESGCGGHFGPALKRAGYDGLVLLGAAPRPVWLYVGEEEVRLESAEELWGLDTYEVAEHFWRSLKGRPSVLSIGPAGENLVEMANVNNDRGDVLGRTGLGAVMGSKRLKAVVASGRARTPVPPVFKKARGPLFLHVRDHVISITLREYGTSSGLASGRYLGDVPTRNWTVGDPGEMAEGLSGMALKETYLVKNAACHGCPISCKRVVRVAEGPYALEEGPGPEYETLTSLGTLTLTGDLALLCKANELVNRLGMDSISAGSAVAFAIECYESGILGKEDTDGLELRWGNGEAILSLLQRMARKEGIGALLAKGVKRAAAEIGGGAERLAMEVKGLEVPMHDPRAFHSMGLAYAVSNRGACHNRQLNMYLEIGVAHWPEVGVAGLDRLRSEGKGRVNFISENVAEVCDAGVLCIFAMAGMTPSQLAQMVNAATGFGYSLAELLEVGERSWMLKRALNCMWGVRAADDRLPERLLTPLPDGGAAGSAPDLPLMLREYYEVRGLDGEGRPRRERLLSLGLGDVADALGV